MYQAKSSLEVAVEAAARVDAVLAKKGKIKPNPIATALATANKSSTDLFQTEFEINDVPVTARNLLTKGITQEEINHFSGASISTRGRYVIPEDRDRLPKSERPLYLFIQGPNKQSLDLAIQRIDSLIKEVMEQEKFKMCPPPPLMTMQTSLPGMEKVIVGLDNAPPTFEVRNKVLGPGGANLQYISNETGAIVTLRGRISGYPECGTGQESAEPLHICVEHQKIEVLQAARQLAFNLVDTIQQEFAQVHPQMPPQPGPLQTVALQADQLPPGMVATSLQHAQVAQLVNMPPHSLAVPPPQLVQQPPPAVTLPPPGIHIPAHQGPLVPQHQVLNQPPPNVSQAPPTSAPQAQTSTQQTQAFITHATYPVQYIQAANGQTLMAYQSQQQVKADATGQLQLIQTQHGQSQQLQLIPGTQQLLMQQPQQQVTMLLQYQQQSEPGKGGRLVAGQQRLATPVQIQLQPGMQLINPQLLQSGQTQFQLQLQQPLAQQLLQQAVRAVAPQQVALQQTRLPQQQAEQQHIQLQQQHIFQLPVQQQQAPPQNVQGHNLQQQNLQVQQNPQVQHHPQNAQQQLQIQQSPQQVQHQPLQQPQPIQQQLQQPQQQMQQSQQQVQQSNQQMQQSQQHMQQPQQHIQQPQQHMQQPQQIQHQHMQQPQQQMQQTQQQMQQTQQQMQQTQQQIQPQQQPQQQQMPVQHLQTSAQVQRQQIQQTQQSKETLQQKNQQKPNQGQQNQQPSPNRASQSQPQQQQQGQKRRYEDDQPPQNVYQGPPQPVPPPKVPPPKQASATGIGNGPNMAQKPAATQMSQLLPQIQKQLMPPPPPPQQGAPDDWRNNPLPDQMNQANRGDQHQPQQGGNINRQERPTFNHYSSKPQLYNASMPFHMQGLGTYPPPPPPPPPAPFYPQQQPPANQYPYFMMHHQQ